MSGNNMTNNIDLHLHSNCSDGAYSPEKLVLKAKESGLDTIALTDHDNVSGISAAKTAGYKYGLKVIAGVELSLTYKKYTGIHLLGYYIDWENRVLTDALADIRQVRAKRGDMIVEKINILLKQENKTLLNINELKKIAKGSIGRPHISQMLIKAGHVNDVNEAFERYLTPCNVPKKKLSPQEGIDLIKQAKGLPVLAHPTILTDERGAVSAKEQHEVIDYMLAQGIIGLESFYTGYDSAQADFFVQLAHKYNLVTTAGSDFHRESGQALLGKLHKDLAIPADVIAQLENKYLQLYGTIPV